MQTLCRPSVNCVPGDGCTVRSILSAIGPDRLHNMKLVHGKSFTDNEGNNVTVHTKVSVGKEGCTVLDLQWVPENLKDIGPPENMTTFGAPHLHTFATGCRKLGHIDIPFWGFSQFVIGISGACWLVSWPASYATDLALDVATLFDAVALQKKDVFMAFFNEKIFHCLVRRDTVAFVPSGHCYALIPLQGQENGRTSCLTVPYMSVKLMQNTAQGTLKAVGDVIQNFTKSAFVLEKPKICAMHNQFLQWFQASRRRFLGEEEEVDDGEDAQGASEGDTQPGASQITAATVRLEAESVTDITEPQDH